MGAPATTIGLWIQYALVALAVLASAIHVVRHRFPAALRRLRVALALWLLRGQRPAWVHALGRRIAPAPLAGGDGEDGCGGCDGCGPTRTP